MRRIAKYVFIASLLLVSTPCFSFCQAISVDELVKQYSSATEVKKQELIDTYKYQIISAGGIIEDVSDWASYDEENDRSSNYYKVTTQRQALNSGSSYQVIIFYKEKNSVNALVSGHPINVNAALVKIIDEPGLLSVWVYADELMPEDKAMFEAYL